MLQRILSPLWIQKSQPSSIIPTLAFAMPITVADHHGAVTVALVPLVALVALVAVAVVAVAVAVAVGTWRGHNPGSP